MDTIAVSVPSLPSGFVLDDDNQAPEPPQGFVADTGGQTPAPPPGFVVDGGAPQEQPGATLADYGRSAMVGGAQVGRGAGWGLRQLGKAIDSEGIAGAGRGLEDVSQRAVEYWQEGMTPAAQAERGKQFVRETPEGDYERGDAGLATAGLMAAGSALPSMLGMGIGGVAAKGLGAASGAMGAGAHPAIEGAIGYGLGEAAVSAPTAGAEVYDRVMGLDVGALEQHPEYAALKEQYGDKTQEAIADAASLQAAGQTALSTFVLSAPMGAMLGKILRGVPTATTRARAVASGAAGEAGQEFAQSGAEQALSNLAVQQIADPSQRLGEGVLEAAVGGAAAGGLMGGGIGTMARLEPAQPAPVAPEPAVPEPAVPLAQPGEPFSLDTAENQGEIWTYMGPSRTNPATMAEMISPNGIVTDVGLDVLVPMEQALEQETTQPTPDQAQQAAPQDAAIPAALPEGAKKGPGVVPAEEAVRRELVMSEAATSPNNNLPEPTAAQKEAGNYKKAHVSLHGMDISIENPRGSKRSGIDSDGERWETEMVHDYGYIKGTVGKDKDHLDVFLGPDPQSTEASVFVVDQVDPTTGKFDEHKILIGFPNEESARKGYLANYAKGWKGAGEITELRLDAFKGWIEKGKTTRPIGPQQVTEYAKQDTEAEKGDGRGVPQPPIEVEDTEKGGVQVQPRGPGGREKEEITSGLPVQREGGEEAPGAGGTKGAVAQAPVDGGGVATAGAAEGLGGAGIRGGGAEGGRGVEPSGGVGPVAGEEGGIVSADFNEMVADAARWQGAARKVAARYGDDKKAALRHSRMTTKGDMDAYLMRKFGIDEATARAVSNHLTAQDIKPNESGRPEDFQGEPWADVEQQKEVSGAEKEAPGEEPWTARLDFDAETIERHPDLKDPEAMAGIRRMAEGAGWSEIGGRVIRGADGQVSGRTVWTPKEAWFAEKPQGVTAQHFKGAVERLDAGRKLTKPQREALSFMVAYTQEMQADELTPTAGTNEYDSMSAFDKGLTVLALELDEIDPGAGESILESAATRDLSNAETRVEIEKALSDKRVASTAGAEAGRGEEFGLEGQTETQARQKDAEVEQRKQAELEQERKDKADRERGEFVLSGSTAAVDEAEARGQANLFGARKKGAQAGTSPEVVQRSARRVVAKHDLLGKGVNFVVAPTSASLPKHIRAAMKTQGAEGDVQGVLDGRTVYLVASRLDSPADVERVILHEMLGHHGARKLFGPRVVSRVSRVHKAVGGDAGIRALGRKYGFDMEPYFETANELYKNDPLGREFLLADELLAHLAQSGPKSLPVKVVRALREFIGAMRDWLARHGYRSLAKMNDADLAYLLRNMRKAAKAPAGKEVQPIRGIEEQAFSRKATGYTEGIDSLLEKTGGDMTKAGKRLHTASMHHATKQLAHGRGELHFMTRSAMGAGAFDLVDGFYDPETKVFLSREDAKRVVRATYGETIGAPSKTHLESQELRRTRNADEAAGRATGIEVEELAADDPALEGLELPWAAAARFARVTKAPPAATRRKPGAVVGNVETTPVSPDIRYSRMRQSGRPRSGEFIITGYDDYGRPKFGKTRHESLKHKSVLRAAMDKYFTKEGNLTRETFDRKIKMEGDKSAVDVTAEFLTHAMRRAAVKSLRKPWSKIDAATKREINEQLAGRKTNLPKSVKAAIAPLRADLDARSNGLIRMKLDLIQLRMAGLDDKTRTATAAAMDDIMSGRTDYADMDMTGLDKYSISGVAMIKTIQANKGEYLNRAYQIHDDPKWEKRVRENTRVMAAAEGFIRDEVEMKDLARKEKEARAIVEKATPWKEEIKGPGTMADKAQRRRERVDAEIENIQGLAEDEVKALVDGAISRMLLAGAKSRDLVSFLSSEQLGQKDLGILMRRKGIPEPIRMLLGEYKDPQYNYVRSASKMTHLTASHDFLMGVRRDGLGQFLSLGETKAFPAEITTFAAEEMNPLTGLYTTPEFNEAMKDAVGPKQLDGLIRTALAANSAVKYGATVLSPITAARNFYSAGFFTVMNGHFNWGHAKKSAAITLADLAKKGDTEAAKDYTVKMVELGVLHSGVRSEELWDAAQDALDMDKPQSRTSEALKTAFIKIPTKIYRAGDDFWKVIGFENERAGLMKHRGMSEAQAEKVAAERIRNGYPTYSHVPRTIQMLRRFPLMGPFVSFPWEIMRTTSHQLRFLKEDYDAGAMPLVYRRAAGMIVAGSIGQAVSLAAMAALGLDSDDDEAYRENGPRWQRNSQLFYHRDNEGKMWTLDLSHLDPYTYLKAPITALLSGRDVTPMAKLGDAMVQLLEPFLGVEITTGAIVEVLMNQRIDSGAPVYNEAASDWDKAGAALNHLRRKLQPGLARQLENLYLASQGYVSRGGKEYTLPGEAATFVGFRFTPMNPEISLKYRAYEFNDARSDASRLLSYPLSDPNKLTVGGIKDAYDSMIEARKLLYKDMITAVKSSKTLGMTNMEVRRMLRGAGVSGKDISALIRGEVAKWRPSPQFLRRSQATLLAAVKTPAERAEVRRLFGERRREVQRLATVVQ